MTCILIFIGGLVGGQKGALLALLIAGALNFVTYWFSDRIVLAMSLFIVNPFGGGGVAKLFSTHPPVAERIRRLALLAGGSPASKS